MKDAVRRFRSRLDGCESSLVVVKADRPLRPKMLRRLSLDIPTMQLASYKASARTHQRRFAVNTLRAVAHAQACVKRQFQLARRAGPLTEARIAVVSDGAALEIDGDKPHFPGWRDWGVGMVRIP
jgi:hypothetical protein